MSGDVPETLRGIADSQAGVVSRQQALQAGMSRDSVRSRVKWDRWQRVHPGVYALQPRLLGRDAGLWAALLWAGDDAVLSHHSAAEVHGLIDEPAPMVHVMIPQSRRLLQRPGVQIHRSDRVCGMRERYPRGCLPATWPADTVLDLAQMSADPDEMCDWIARAFRKRQVSEGMLLAAMSRRPQVRHREDILYLIREAASGAHSPLEFRYDRDVERAHSLPAARRQVPYRRDDGTRGYRDRCYEHYRVIVELDGEAFHEDGWADMSRDNTAAAEHGSQTLRFGWRSVRWHPCDTAVTVAKVLHNHGWTGVPRPCASDCPVAKRTWGV